jgi:hypothetical protein
MNKRVCVLLVSLFFVSAALAQKQTKGAFILPASMIQSFNAKTFELELTPAGKDSVESMDFTRYSFLQLPDAPDLYLLIKEKMESPLPELFIYKSGKSLLSKNGTIRFEMRHLKQGDPQVIRFKKRMQAIIASNKKG